MLNYYLALFLYNKIYYFNKSKVNKIFIFFKFWLKYINGKINYIFYII